MDNGHATTQSKVDVSSFSLIMITLMAISLASCAPRVGIITAQVHIQGSARGNVSYDGAVTTPSSPIVSDAFDCIDTRTSCLGSTKDPKLFNLVAPLESGTNNTMVSRLLQFNYLQPGLWSLRATIATREKRIVNFCKIPVEAGGKTVLTIFMQNTPPNAAYRVNDGPEMQIQPCE